MTYARYHKIEKRRKRVQTHLLPCLDTRSPKEEPLECWQAKASLTCFRHSVNARNKCFAPPSCQLCEGGEWRAPRTRQWGLPGLCLSSTHSFAASHRRWWRYRSIATASRDHRPAIVDLVCPQIPYIYTQGGPCCVTTWTRVVSVYTILTTGCVQSRSCIAARQAVAEGNRKKKVQWERRGKRSLSGEKCRGKMSTSFCRYRSSSATARYLDSRRSVAAWYFSIL